MRYPGKQEVTEAWLNFRWFKCNGESVWAFEQLSFKKKIYGLYWIFSHPQCSLSFTVFGWEWCHPDNHKVSPVWFCLINDWFKNYDPSRSLGSEEINSWLHMPMVTGGRDDAYWEMAGGERCSSSLLSCLLQRADEKIDFRWVKNADLIQSLSSWQEQPQLGLLLTDASLTWFKKMLLGCCLKAWGNSTKSQNCGLFCAYNFKALWQLWAASGSCSMCSCFPSPFS